MILIMVLALIVDIGVSIGFGITGVYLSIILRHIILIVRRYTDGRCRSEKD